MNITVFDDVFDKGFAEFIGKYLIALPHTYNEYSIDQETGMNMDDSDLLRVGHLAHNLDKTWMNDEILKRFEHIIHKHIGDDFLDYHLDRFHTNMHFPEVGGKSYHRDQTALTAVWCATDHDGGSFNYLDNQGDSHEIEDRFNRFIIFQEPEMQHKAIPPKTNTLGPRVTVAVKYKQLNNPNN